MSEERVKRKLSAILSADVADINSSETCVYSLIRITNDSLIENKY
jgi:hypothetical protein